MELAEAIGRRQWGDAGVIWMSGLEVALLCRFPRRRNCDKNRRLRLRRQVGLIGGPSDGKSACLEQFVMDLSGCKPYGAHGGGPSYFLMDGDGVTKEGIRGGVSEGNLVMPILHDVDILLSLEFQSWLQSGPSTTAKVQWLNSLLEEGHITIKPLSIGSVKPNKRAMFADTCAMTPEGKRVFFDNETGIISYNVWCSLFFATVPVETIDAKLAAYMLTSGFRSRIAESVSDPSEEDSNRRSENPFGEEDERLNERLKAFHQYAWNCRFSSVPAVPYALANQVLARNMDTYRRISMETTVPIRDFASNRDFIDAVQLIVAFAVMRRLWARMQSGAEAGDEGTLDYTEEDVKAAMAYRVRILRQVERRVEGMAKEDKVRDAALAELISFMRKRRPEETLDDKWWLPEPFDTSELAHHIVENRGVARQTAYAHIAKLRKAGHLSLIEKTGLNDVGDRVLTELKVLPRHFRARLEEEERLRRMESDDEHDHFVDLRELGGDEEDEFPDDPHMPTVEESLEEVERLANAAKNQMDGAR